MTFNNFLDSQIYVLFMFFIMTTIGIIKEYNLFEDFFGCLNSKVKSKRLLLFFTSLFAGMLPIPGRVAVSANIIYSLTPRDNSIQSKKSKSKLGLIDYISTHHYYLWSPLEKTVIIPMSVLSLSYLQVMSYLYPLLIITILYSIWFIFLKIKETDIIIDLISSDYKVKNIITYFVPFILSIIFLILNIKPVFVFGILTLYYMLITKLFDFKKILSFINWKVLIIIGLVSLLGKYVNIYSSEINTILETLTKLNYSREIMIFITSSIIFIAALIMGSSSKFAGWVAMLTAIFGIQYFIWFFVIEFIAYNFSPSHKCIPIGTGLFGTSLLEYIKTIGLWQLLLLIYAFVYTFII